MAERKIISPAPEESDKQFEAALRPTRLADFTGQQKVKEILSISIEAARLRGEALDHVLLYGPPGLGKTTLANIVANELAAGFEQTSAPILQKKLDLTGVLSNIKATRFSSSMRFIGCCRTLRRCSMRRWKISASIF